MKIRKSHLTLIEVMIALTLLSLLLTTLFGVYQHIESLHQLLHKDQKTGLRMLYVQHRLSEVIPNAVSRKVKEAYFYNTSNPYNSLVFVYDNGADPNPKFSGYVLGRLYLDPQSKLCLVTWPSVKTDSNANPEMRKEILLEKVKDLSFSFYVPPKEEKLTVDPAKTNERPTQWYPDWPMEMVNTDEISLPGMIKIKIQVEGNQEITFAFVLPNSERSIMYVE